MLNKKHLLIIILAVFVSCQSSAIYDYRRKLPKIAISGKVIHKHIDKRKGNARMVILADSSIESLYLLEVYEKLKIGDSIYKEKGELCYKIIRNNDTTEIWPKTQNYIVKPDTLIPY